MDPVEEFAEIRAQIKALKTREEALRSLFISDDIRRKSNSHEVVIRETKRRIFLKDKLPAEILDDPQYWEERSSKIVTIKSLRAKSDNIDLIDDGDL